MQSKIKICKTDFFAELENKKSKICLTDFLKVLALNEIHILPNKSTVIFTRTTNTDVWQAIAAVRASIKSRRNCCKPP